MSRTRSWRETSTAALAGSRGTRPAGGARSGGGLSCAERLARAGVVRVVIGAADPSPYASGLGEERLRAAGVAVDAGVLADEAEALYEDYSPGSF